MCWMPANGYFSAGGIDGRLKMHGQDAPLALADQHHFLGHVVRVNRGLGDHQEQDLGAFQCIDDLFAPLRCRIDPSLIDPQGDARRAKLGGEIEDAILVLTGITDEDLCRLGH